MFFILQRCILFLGFILANTDWRHFADSAPDNFCFYTWLKKRHSVVVFTTNTQKLQKYSQMFVHVFARYNYDKSVGNNSLWRQKTQILTSCFLTSTTPHVTWHVSVSTSTDFPHSKTRHHLHKYFRKIHQIKMPRDVFVSHVILWHGVCKWLLYSHLQLIVWMSDSTRW